MSFEQISVEETITVPKDTLQEFMQVCEAAINSARSGGMSTILFIVSALLLGVSAYFVGRGHGSEGTARDIFERQVAERLKKNG